MITARELLVRGLLAGLVAGVLAFAVAYVVGEPPIDQAIALEEAGPTAEPPPADHTHADGEEVIHSHGEEGLHSHGEEGAHSHGEGGTEVSRDLQSTAGLLTGLLVVGAVLGGVAGVVTALALGRVGRGGVRATALGVAAAGFVVLYLVPYLVYPPNPPAVGSGDTIGDRTRLYFILLGLSVLAAVAAAVTARAATPRVGAWYAGLAGVGLYVVAMLVTISVMPRYDEVGADFPAQVLYDFRLSSLLTQLALWAGIGVVLAELGGRLGRREAVPHEERATVAA